MNVILTIRLTGEYANNMYLNNGLKRKIVKAVYTTIVAILIQRCMVKNPKRMLGPTYKRITNIVAIRNTPPRPDISVISPATPKRVANGVDIKADNWTRRNANGTISTPDIT